MDDGRAARRQVREHDYWPRQVVKRVSTFLMVVVAAVCAFAGVFALLVFSIFGSEGEWRVLLLALALFALAGGLTVPAARSLRDQSRNWRP